jgi:hypothetical protein
MVGARIDDRYLNGFTNAETRQIAVIVFEYLEQFKAQWHGYFNQ